MRHYCCNRLASLRHLFLSFCIFQAGTVCSVGIWWDARRLREQLRPELPLNSGGLAFGGEQHGLYEDQDKAASVVQANFEGITRRLSEFSSLSRCILLCPLRRSILVWVICVR